MRESNVLLLTLDSCAYSTAVRAFTPNLDSIGTLQKAEAAGNYTLPAHIAMFNGHLPRTASGKDRLWRSSLARSREPALTVFQGKTLMEYYKNEGFHVVGIGGVSFFDDRERDNLLPSLFPTFYYFGTGRTGSLRQRLTRRGRELPLARTDEILESIGGSDRFFFFINCSATHIPYTTPETDLTNEIVEAVTQAYRAHDHKWGRQLGNMVTPHSLVLLRDLQVAGLEWADERFGLLLQALDYGDELLVVVCADHGEEFGEGGRYGHGHNHPSVLDVPLWSGVLRRPFQRESQGRALG